uniref:ribosomal protein S20 n=1 Tax=Rhodella violacea TaxID=2801 RepID=UPI001FCE28C8|nr:ribosomal protein S20 [Rhodella violacea]UNJ18005.1 ribosomal protein S20 [Rhodella violacea]
MANKKSAIKRVTISERNRLRNKSYKSVVKTLIKKSLVLINQKDSQDMEKINQVVSMAYSKIDKAVKVGALKLNQGSRKKSMLIKALKTSNAAT